MTWEFFLWKIPSPTTTCPVLFWVFLTIWKACAHYLVVIRFLSLRTVGLWQTNSPIHVKPELYSVVEFNRGKYYSEPHLHNSSNSCWKKSHKLSYIVISGRYIICKHETSDRLSPRRR